MIHIVHREGEAMTELIKKVSDDQAFLLSEMASLQDNSLRWFYERMVADKRALLTAFFAFNKVRAACNDDPICVAWIDSAKSEMEYFLGVEDDRAD